MRIAALFPHPPLIIPGVGEDGEIPGTRAACEKMAAEIEGYQPDTVVVITPHNVLYDDYFHISPGDGARGSFARFGAIHARFQVNYDRELAATIGGIARGNGIPAGFDGERDPSLDHGTMVPLHFLSARRIVRLSLSGLDMKTHLRYGRCIRMASGRLGRRVALVASGDMSHKLSASGPYGLSEEGAIHDAYVRECLEQADFRRLMEIDRRTLGKAAECGFRSIVILAGFLDGARAKTDVLHYEAPYGVGYLCGSFHTEEDAFVALARSTVEDYIYTGRAPAPPEGLPPEMTQLRTGVFVTIKKDGELRGCIGTISPTCISVAGEIVQNSVSACSEDPRFPPVQAGELASLSYSVDVLGQPEQIDSTQQLDVKRYGVIVSQEHRRGLLLPNLEGIEDVQEQVSIAARKGAVNMGRPYTLQRFEVVRHK